MKGTKEGYFIDRDYTVIVLLIEHTKIFLLTNYVTNKPAFRAFT